MYFCNKNKHFLNNIMILHLVNDEKIINRTIDLFEEAFPEKNIFVVTTSKKQFKHVRTGKQIMSRKEFLAKQDGVFIHKIIIHFLNIRKINFIHQLKINNPPIYWIIWGADLYNNLLQPQGYELFDPQGAFYKKQRLKRVLFSPISFIQNKTRVAKTIRFIQNRIDYLVTDTTENDYDILLQYFPQLKSKPWGDFFYYPIDHILGDALKDATVNGSSIIIGNSGSLTNNHEYAMRLLSKLNTGNRKIVVPLSYSGKKEYLDIVIEKGKELFGENFEPLLEFMPLGDYNRLQQSVNIAIYGNWRQEAIGNILISLYLGAKVFISNKNPILAWAKGHNLVVFELEQMTQEEIDTSLSPEIQQLNRDILIGLYNKERLFELMKKLF